MATDTNTTEKPLLLPSREAARLLSLAPEVFRRKVRSGDLPAPVELGGARRWRYSDIVAVAEGGR